MPPTRNTGLVLAICLDAAAFAAALVVGLLPVRVWPAFETRLPLARAAFLSGIATAFAGFLAGFSGFLRFAGSTADANNAWMLARLTGPAAEAARTSAALVPYTFSVLALFAFLFGTPLGLLCTYLVISGAVRAISAWVDDPHGDFLLSAAHWICTTAAGRNRVARSRAAREREEGPDAPDVLWTGARAGIDADYVVLAARRKPEWSAGAVIMTGTDWYRLGEPLDIRTPVGLRAAYPLRRLLSPEVVRRGIEYELPPLRSARAAAAPANPQL